MQLSGPTPPIVPVLSRAPKVPQFTPAQQQRYDAAIKAEGNLVVDALKQVGVQPSALKGIHFLPNPLGTDEVTPGTGTTTERGLNIPLGLKVSTGSAAQDQWTVVGLGANKSLELAQRSPDGTIVRSTQPFAALVERNAQLLDSLDDGLLKQLVPDGLGNVLEGVQALGRRAPISFTTPAQLLERVKASQPKDPRAPQAPWAPTRKEQPFTLASTWGEVLDQTGLAKRSPQLTAPGYDGAVNLRALVGDKRNVFSSIGLEHTATVAAKAPDGSTVPQRVPLSRPLLIGTDSIPGPGKTVLDDIEATQKWFKDVAKVDVFPRSRKLYADTDQSAWLANASAGQFPEADGTQTISLNEGPRDVNVRGAMLAQMTGHEGQATRKVSGWIQGGLAAVETHEAGHVVNGNNWRNHGPQETVETGIADEALADLFGASRAKSIDLAHIRGMTTLQNGFGNLDILRSGIAKTGGEVHTGTQLITKPMMGLAKTVGFPMLAEITAAASQSLGVAVANDMKTVDIPAAASALRNAAAWRLGDQSKAIRDLDAAFAQVKVPITPLTNAPRERD